MSNNSPTSFFAPETSAASNMGALTQAGLGLGAGVPQNIPDVSQQVDPKKVYLAKEMGQLDGLNDIERDFATRSVDDNALKYGDQAYGIASNITDAAVGDAMSSMQTRTPLEATTDTAITLAKGLAEGGLAVANMANMLNPATYAIDKLTGSNIRGSVANVLNSAQQGIENLAEMGYSDVENNANLIKGYKNKLDEARYQREYDDAVARGESAFGAGMAQFAKGIYSGLSNALTSPTAWTDAPAELLGSVLAMGAVGKGAKALGAVAKFADTALTRAVMPAAERASIAARATAPTAEEAMGLGARAVGATGATADEIAAGTARAITPMAESAAVDTALSATNTAGKGALEKLMDNEMVQGGLQEGGSASLDAYDSVMKMSDEELTDSSDMYRQAKEEYLAQGLSEEEAETKAKQDVANSASTRAGIYNGLMAAPMGKLMPKGLIKNPIKTFFNPKDYMRNVTKDSLEEGLENLGAIGGNEAARETYNNDQDILEGVAQGVGEGAISAFVGTAEMGAPRAALQMAHKGLQKGSEKLFGESSLGESRSSAKEFKVNQKNLQKEQNIIKDALNNVESQVTPATEAEQNSNETSSTQEATTIDPIVQSAKDTLNSMNNAISSTFNTQEEADEFNQIFSDKNHPIATQGSSKAAALSKAANVVHKLLNGALKNGINSDPDTASYLFGVVNEYQNQYDELFKNKDLTSLLATASDEEQKAELRQAFDSYDRLANTAIFSQINEQANKLASTLAQQQADLANNTTMSQEDKVKAYQTTMQAYARLLDHTLMSNSQLQKAKTSIEEAQKAGIVADEQATAFLNVIDNQIKSNNELDSIEEQRLQKLTQIALTEKGEDFFDSPEEARKFASGKGITEVQFQKLHNQLGISDGKRSLHSTRKTVADLMSKGRVGDALQEMVAYKNFVQSQINKLNAYKDSHAEWLEQHVKDGGKGAKTQAKAKEYTSYNPSQHEWYTDSIYAGNPMLGAALAVEEEALISEFNALQKRYFPEYGQNAKNSPLKLTGYKDLTRISNAGLVNYHEHWKTWQKAQEANPDVNTGLYASEEKEQQKAEGKSETTNTAELTENKTPQKVTESDFVLALMEDQGLDAKNANETSGYLLRSKSSPKIWQVPERHTFKKQENGITDVKGMEHLKPLTDDQQTTPRTRAYAVVGSLNKDSKKIFSEERMFSSLEKNGLTLRTNKTGKKDENLEGLAESNVSNKSARLRGIRAGHVNSVYPSYYTSRAKEISTDLFNKDGKLSQVDQTQNTATTMQVLGIDLASPVDFVISYSPKDSNGNYTEGKEAIELAQKLNIPVFNFAENPEQTKQAFDKFLEAYNKEKTLQNQAKDAVEASIDKVIATLEKGNYKGVSALKEAKPKLINALWHLDLQNTSHPEDEINSIVDEVNDSLVQPLTDEANVLADIKSALKQAFDFLQKNALEAKAKRQEYETANTVTTTQLQSILKDVDQEFGLSQQNVDMSTVENKLHNFKLDTATNLDSVRSLLSDVIPTDKLTSVAESLQKKLFALSPLEKERVYKEQEKAKEKALAEQEAKDANTRFTKVTTKLFGLSGGKYQSLPSFKDSLIKLADPKYQRKPGEMDAKDASALLAALDSSPNSPNSLFNKVKTSLAEFCSANTKFYSKDGDYKDSKGKLITGKAPYFAPNEDSVFYKTFKERGYETQQKTDDAGIELFTETETGDTIPETENARVWQEHRQIRISYKDVMSVLNDPTKAKDVSSEEFNELCQIYPTLMLMTYDENGKLVPNDDIVGNLVLNSIAMFNNQKEGSGYTWERLAENFKMTVGELQRIPQGKSKKVGNVTVESVSGAKFLELASSSIMFKPLFTGLKHNMRKSLGLQYDPNMLEAAAQRVESVLATSMIDALTQNNIVTRYTCNIGNTVTLYAINNKETSIFSTLTDPDALNRALGNERAAEEGEIVASGKAITKSTNNTILNSNIKLSEEARRARDNYEQRTAFKVDEGMYALYESLHKNNSKDLLALYGERIEERMDPADRLSKESANSMWLNSWNKIQRWVKGMRDVANAETNGDLSKVEKHFRFNFTGVNRIQEVESYGPTANKQTREVLLSTWNTVTIDPTLCENPNTKEHAIWGELAAAVLQNFGAKLNADTVESATAAFTDLVRSARANTNQKKYASLLKLVKDPSNVTAEDVMAAQDAIANFMQNNKHFQSLNLKKVDQNFMSLHAMQTLAQVVMAQREGKPSFNSSLYVECDGTTNGSIFGKFLFSAKIADVNGTDIAVDVIRDGDMGNVRLGDPFGGTAGSVKHGKQLDANGNPKPKDLYEKSAQLAQDKIKQVKADLIAHQVDNTTQRGIYNNYYQKNEIYTVSRSSTGRGTDSSPEVVIDRFERVIPKNKTDINEDPTTMTVEKLIHHVENLCRLSGITSNLVTELAQEITRKFMKSPDTKGGYGAGIKSIIDSFLYGDRNNAGLFKTMSEYRTKVLMAEKAKAEENGGKKIPLTHAEIAKAIFGDNPELQAKAKAKWYGKDVYEEALDEYLAALNALTQNKFNIERDDDGNVTSVTCKPAWVKGDADSWNTNKHSNNKRYFAPFGDASFGSYFNDTTAEGKQLDTAGYIADISNPNIGTNDDTEENQSNLKIAQINLSADNQNNIYQAIKAVYGNAIVDAVNETLKGEATVSAQENLLDFSARTAHLEAALQSSKINRVNENSLTVSQYNKEFRNNISKDNPLNNLVEYNSFSNSIGNTEELSRYELSGGSIDNYQQFGRATKQISESYLNWGNETQELSQITYECVTQSGARFIPTTTIGCGDATMMQTSMLSENYSAKVDDSPLKVFDGQNNSVGHVSDGGYAINRNMFETAILQNPSENILIKVLDMDAAIDAALQADNTSSKEEKSDVYNTAEDFSDMMNYLCFRDKTVEETDANGNITTKTVKTPYVGCWDTLMNSFVGLSAPLELAKIRDLGDFDNQKITNARNKAIKEFILARKKELTEKGQNVDYTDAVYSSEDFVIRNFDSATLRAKANEFVFKRFMHKYGDEVNNYINKYQNIDGKGKKTKKTGSTTVAEAVSAEQNKKSALSERDKATLASGARAMAKQIEAHQIPDHFLKKHPEFFGLTKTKEVTPATLHTAYKKAQIEEYRSAIAMFLGEYTLDNQSDPFNPILTYSPLAIESKHWGVKDKITTHNDGTITRENGTLSVITNTTKELSDTFASQAEHVAFNHAAMWCMGATCDHMASGPNPYVLNPLDPATGGGISGFRNMCKKLHLKPKSGNYDDAFNAYQLSEARALLDGVQSLYSNSADFINDNTLIPVRLNGAELQMTTEQIRGEVLRQMESWLRKTFGYDISEISNNALEKAKNTTEKNQQLKKELSRRVQSTTVADYLANNKDTKVIDQILSDFSDAFDKEHSTLGKSTKIIIVSGFETQQKDSSPLSARIKSRETLEAIYREDMEKAHKEPSQNVIDHINGQALIASDNEEAKKVNGRDFTPVQFYEPATNTIYILNPNPSGFNLDRSQSKLRHEVILPHEIMHSLSDKVITHFEDNDYSKWLNRKGNSSWFKNLSPMRKKAYAALERLHNLKAEIDNLSDDTLSALAKENKALEYYLANKKYLTSGQAMTEFLATFGTMSDEQLSDLTDKVKQAGKGATLHALTRESERELSTLEKLVKAVKNAYEAFLRIFTGKESKSDIQRIIHSNLAILNIARNVELDTNSNGQQILQTANSTPSFLSTITDNGKESSETVDAESATVEDNSRPVDTLSQLDKLANNLVRTVQDRVINLREAAIRRKNSNAEVTEKAAAIQEYQQKLAEAEAEAYQIANINNVINTVAIPLQNLGFNTGDMGSFAKVISTLSLVKGLKSPVYGELSLTVRKVLDSISPETFCSDPTNSVQLSKGLIITNFLQGVGQDSLKAEHITPVFLALSQTDPKFREILSKIKFPTKNTEGYLAADKVLNNCLEKLSGTLNSIKGITPNKTFVDAFDNAILQMLKTEGSLARVTLADTAADKVDAALSATMGKLAKPIKEGIGKKLGIPANEMTANMVTIGENKLNSVEQIPHFFKEGIHDMVGCTDQNYEFYEANTRVKVGTQQTREMARQQIPLATKARFKTEVSDETWSRLSRTIGKSSLATLFDGDTATIAKYLSNPSAAAKEIATLSKSLNDKYQIAKCRQLANYMMTGKAGKMLLRNPLAIAQRFGSGKIVENPSKDTINTCDKLASLFALEMLSKEEKDEILNLLKNDNAAMKTLLGTAKNQYDQGIKKASGSNRGKYNWYKGSLISDYQNGAHFKIAPLTRQAEMQRFGYKLVREYAGSNLDGANLGVFYADFSPSNYLNPGAIQLTSSTANGINLATGSSCHPNGGTIIRPDLVKSITANMATYTSKNGEDLMPIFDEKGRVVAYERCIDPTLLNDNKYVKPTTDYAELLGVQEGRTVEEENIDKFNNEIVDILSNQYAKDKKVGNDKYYVNLFDVKDPVVANLVNRIPQKLRDKISNSFDGDGKFMVLPSEINDIIGYHSASITDSWTGESRLPPAVQNAFVYACEHVLGKNAFKYLKKSEDAWHDVITSAKNMIIIRSVTVPAINMFANMLQLYIEGVPVTTIIQQTIHVTKELNQYTKLSAQKVQIQQELNGELAGYRKHQLEAQIKVIDKAIAALDIAPLLEHKEFSSIANLGDLGREFDFSGTTLGDKIIEKIDGLSKNVILKSVTHYGFVTPDTSLYQFLEKANQYGDFIGKAVLYHDLIKRRGYSEKQAHKKIKDEFVDYVRLPGRGRDYMERMGLLWFYNFKLRMLKVAFANLKEHPLRCLALSAMGMPTPMTDSLFGKFPVMSYTMGPTSMLKSAFTSNPWVALLGLLF